LFCMHIIATLVLDIASLHLCSDHPRLADLGGDLHNMNCDILLENDFRLEEICADDVVLRHRSCTGHDIVLFSFTCVGSSHTCMNTRYMQSMSGRVHA
jgi:hypothetical protein